jgi:hypothetical protein
MLSPTSIALPRSFKPSSQMNFLPVGMPHVRCVDWAELARLEDQGTNFAWLERPEPAYQSAISEILASSFEGVQGSIESPAEIEELQAYFDEELNLQADTALQLFDDIALMTQHFFKITKAKEVGVRLERVNTDNCRLFHVDLVRVRLISTLSGLGTEWLKNEDVMRAGLGKQSDELVKRPGSTSQIMKPGWVGLMKGERFFGNQGNGLVHRSPPVQASGQERLVIRMDTLD